jgi:hypothetical protein
MVHYESELDRAEDGAETFFEDMRKWWKSYKSPRVRKTQDLLAIVVMVSIMIAFIYGVFRALTHLAVW